MDAKDFEDRRILVLDGDEIARLSGIAAAALPEGDPLLDKLADDDWNGATDESLARWVRHGRIVREIYNRRRQELGDALIESCPFRPGDVCELDPATPSERKRIMESGGLVRIRHAGLMPMAESVVISYCAPKDSDAVFYGQIALPEARRRLRIVRRE